jgi:Catalase
MSQSIPSRPFDLSPVRYDRSIEQLDEEEAETNQGLIETITKIQQKVYQDASHASRGVHAKGHGILIGELRILGGLPAYLSQGVFAREASYPIVMRFSTIPGDVLDDNISVPRGLALKVIGVPGERVTGSEGDATQDFVLANGPVFAKAHPKSFLSTLKQLAATTDKAPGLKKLLSGVMRGTEKLLESVGGQSATLMTLGGYPEVHILGDEFYSQTPFLYGDYMAKFAVKPLSKGLRDLAKAPLSLKGKPNGIREAVVEFFRANSGEWELQAQLCTDLKAMPIEDAATRWPEDKSPYQPVARIVIPSQDAWSASRIQAVEERMSFSVWHAVALHRPLGAMNRVRKSVYDNAARFRAEHNRVTIAEPTTIADLAL